MNWRVVFTAHFDSLQQIRLCASIYVKGDELARSALAVPLEMKDVQSWR